MTALPNESELAKQTVLSAQEISRAYLQKPLAYPNSLASFADETQRRDLTASARFIVREARKRLGQYTATEGEGEFHARPLSEEALQSLVQTIETEQNEYLSERERNAVVVSLVASSEHYDILSPLILDEEVNDIIISGYNDISVQKNRGNEQTALQFADPDCYRAFVEQLLKRAGKACTMATPVVDVAVDANVRACVTHESFSPPGAGPLLTLRIARHRTISIDG